ncbi:MAG: hypothetical protein J5594_01110 [Elusimicrobiaceae bacterium]|nr:hypothetical protein [Elusimicrobiaceae bacterium]
MKKLHINFVLLFVFVIFVPCLVRADIARMPTREEMARHNKELQLAKEQSKKDIQCVLKRKADLSKEYKGPNLKMEKVTPHLMRGVDFSTKNTYYVDTYLHVFGNYFDKYNRPISGLRMKPGLAYNCKEYIILNNRPMIENGQYNFKEHTSVAYDVTDVPPGSYLKYIPETEEFQILPPTEASYKEIMKGQTKKFKKRNERLKEIDNKRFVETSEDGNEYFKEKIEDTLCLFEKKSNLKEYKGPNLKFGPINCRKYYSVVYGSIPITLPRLDYLTDVKLEEQELRNIISGYKPDRLLFNYVFDGTGSARHIKAQKTLPQKHVVRSNICGCNEYLNIYGDTTDYGYDITNVPLGSYLKFIPETKELQVISPEDGAYEEIIKNQKEPSDLTYYNLYFGNLHANQPEIVLFKEGTYKDFVENEQSKIKNEELKSELRKYAAKLKKGIEKKKTK